MPAALAYVPGDILLFTGTDWADRLIQWATHGPYSHAAIVADQASIVEAIGTGVKRSPWRPAPAVLHTGASLDAMRRTHAIGWLNRTVGAVYSGWDILADGVKAMLPPALSGTPFLVAPSQYDCSQLAAQFLIVGGFVWLPDAWYRDNARLSPNDLSVVLRAYLSMNAAA